MVSDAQRKATNKYRNAVKRQFHFDINRNTRPKMLKYLETVDNVMSYIRCLIAKDMKEKGIETDGMDGEQTKSDNT